MKFLSFILIILFYYTSSYAQLHDSTFVDHEFYSEVFKDERKITVQLPYQYFDYPADSFIVTYVLDGQGPHYFNMQVGNLDYLSSRYGIIPTIIVGIHSKDRFREFTPQPRDPEKQSDKYQLSLLQDHLRKEVFPLIESRFRTHPFKTVVGHSRGGLFVLQTLFDGNKDLFDAYIAISAAIGWDNNQTIDLIESSLSANADLNKFLYCSAGDVGDNELYFKSTTDIIDSLFRSYENPSLRYYYEDFPGKDHFTTVAPSVTQGLVHLKNEYMLSMENIYSMMANSHQSLRAGIDDFIESKNLKGEFLYTPPLRYYRRIASDLFDGEKYEPALEIFQWVDEQDGLNRWWEIFNTGTCLARTGNPEQAQPYYDRAFKALEKRKEEYGDNYPEIVEDLRKQVKENTK